MAEWFKAAVLKTAVRESVPWVRIPPSPPFCLHAQPPRRPRAYGFGSELRYEPFSTAQNFADYACFASGRPGVPPHGSSPKPGLSLSKTITRLWLRLAVYRDVDRLYWLGAIPKYDSQKLGDITGAEFTHDILAMKFYRTGTDLEGASYFLV